VDAAYTQVGVAIEAFEKSTPMQSFSSKFDAVARGQVKFSAPESRGLAIFTDGTRANCAACHAVNVTSKNPEDSLFSEFSYYNTGIPRNRAIPANADPAFFDLGICGPERSKPALPASAPAGTKIDSYCGKFRMPTLRNAAQRQAYMHNGQLKSLREVVEFYSTRISDPQRWYGPSGIPNDLPAAYLGNIEAVKPPFNRKRSDGPVLTEPEINDLLAFLHTLTDGFTAP
jgi:cytochrome c peroxidase